MITFITTLHVFIKHRTCKRVTRSGAREWNFKWKWNQQLHMRAGIVMESFSRSSVTYFQMTANAIISSLSGWMTIYDICDYIKEKYPYPVTANPTGWKRNVRHNLFHHDCFIKAGRCKVCHGKTNCWVIHPANIQNSKGCFQYCCRKAKVKTTMEIQHYLPLQWPPMMYNYLPSSTHPARVCKSSWNEKSLKFNIINTH